ncbi:MAG: NADH-quinone oxidoreductase subunit L [Candidatus Methylomirabilota bacterium]
MLKLVWLVPALPLLGVAVNGIFGRVTRERAHWLGVGTTGLSFLIALAIFCQAAGGARLDWDVYTWMSAGDFRATVGFLVDPLSAVMMLVVTFVGLLIHVYSVGYMHGDPGYARFFTYLNLFMSSMLVLVLANNYLLMFLGWEGVGLCSYLLIGFWYQKPAAADAGKKAFVVNRIGDAGFLLGLFLIWRTFESLHYGQVFSQVETYRLVLERPSVLGLSLVTWIALLLFVGATGKSAQLPLYVWLPDAMEGPTPVSALIHAATMVTAGVYMVARSAAFFNLAPVAMGTVAWVGAITAVFAATIALVQTDIKRVVAYSTISQLGYMFLGCGVGAYASAVFHLATHAFFKALLFLGSGSVIHALSGEQDIRKMGQLKARLPITSRTFYWASLANAGIIPLAGFWSKDEILAGAFAGHHYVLWALGSAGAFMTAFYMFRLYYTVFEGKDNVDPHTAHHIHESPPAMAYPLMALGAGTLLVGALFGFPPDHGLYHRFVGPVFAAAGTEPHAIGLGTTVGLAAVATLIAALGIWGLARSWYKTGDSPAPARAAERFRGLYRLLLNKYWVDEYYNALFIDFGKRLCHRLWGVDARGVDGAVNGTGWLTVALSALSARVDFHGVDGLVNAIADLIQDGSQAVKRIQTGLIQNYLLAMAMGVFVIVSLYVFF